MRKRTRGLKERGKLGKLSVKIPPASLSGRFLFLGSSHACLLRMTVVGVQESTKALIQHYLGVWQGRQAGVRERKKTSCVWKLLHWGKGHGF